MANEQLEFYKIKKAYENGNFTFAVLEKIFKKLGRKTEIVAIFNHVHHSEVTDDMLDSYKEIAGYYK